MTSQLPPPARPHGEPFTPSELREIERSLRQEFRPRMQRGETWTAHGTLDDQHLGLSVVLATEDRTSVTTFECAAAFERVGDVSLVDLRARLVEFLGVMLSSWFRDERWPPPHLDWREYDWEGTPLSFRGSARNEHLEDLADRWLAGATVDVDGVE